ncbi:MAG: preprotein translocase subunit SecG [Christensenellales bacterium]
MFGLIAATAADVYFGFCIAFMVLLLLASIAMIIIVLMQRGTDNNGMSAITGGTDTFFGRHKSRSIDGKFKLATIIVASSMLVFSILFFVFQVLLHQLG